jgi:hypothetical protein
MDEPPPTLKPYANMTIRGFLALADYVRKHIDPPSVGAAAVDVMTEGLKVTIGFDASAKRQPSEYEERKQKAEKAGMTVYDTNGKKRYERLKKEYPGVPPSVLTKSKKDIEEYVKTHQK